MSTNFHNLLPLTTFLPLAPTLSASYPVPEQRLGSMGSIDQRSPTTSNEGAKRHTGTRFLRLGPIHYGEHRNDYQSSSAMLPLNNFLSLIPTMSASFPAPKKRSGSSGFIRRRSSTVSSDDVNRPASTRFLKLGPVHYGEHPEDDQSDFS